MAVAYSTSAPWFSIKETTADDPSGQEHLSATEVIERVNEILGYDILQDDLMAEGYAELGTEMLSISESTLGAQTEPQPEAPA